MAWTKIFNTWAGLVTDPTTGSVDSSGSKSIFVHISWYHPSGSVTLSDNKSNSWTGRTAQVAASSTSRIFECNNPTVGTGHTFTVTGSVVSFQVVGFDRSFTYDTENGNATTATTISTGSVTPAANDSLLLSGWTCDGDPDLPSINSSFTISDSNDLLSGHYFAAGFAYLNLATAAATNPTWSWDGDNLNTAATIAVYTPVAVGHPARKRMGGVMGAYGGYRPGGGQMMWRHQQHESGLWLPDRRIIQPENKMAV